MGMQVTIGVCVRNCQTLILEAISSIMGQDFPHNRIKVVFVDDGSEDGTLSTIQNSVKKMDMVTTVLHTPWAGLGNARNMVIANSEGDYILWVDGDMILSPVFLSSLVDFMERNPKASIVKGKQALVSGGNVLASLEAYSRAVGRMVDYQSKKGQSKVVGTGGALYRINAVKQVGGFDSSLRGYNEDWDVELRMRKAGWTFYTFDVFFHDYERTGLKWGSLWRRYWLRGYQTHYFLHKHKGMIKHYKMFPAAAALFGLFSSFTLFKLTREKCVFFLPIHSSFKMFAWYVGFVDSHFVGYAPKT